MKIIDVFKSSNEKKLADKLSEIKLEQLGKDKSLYARFERMRQSWGEPDINKNGEDQIYYKILKKGEYVTQKDIDDIKKGPKYGEILNTKEFGKYISYLQRLKKIGINQVDTNEYEEQCNSFVNSGRVFLKNFEVYKNYFEFILKNNWVVSQKEIMAIVDIAEQGKLQLNNMVDNLTAIKTILTSNLKNLKIKNKYGLLKLAQEVQNWMYGENNFYQKGAQKFVSKYKDVYGLMLKCDKNKFKKYIQQLNDDEKNNMSIIYGVLCSILADAYGENSKEFKESSKLQICFS